MKKKREWFDFNKAMILLTILALFVLFKTALKPYESISNIAEEAEIVLDTLTNLETELSLMSSNGLEKEKIEKLYQMDYEDIKSAIGVENDFCIFFEDISSNVIKIDSLNQAIGSDKIYVNGEHCK